MRDTSFPAGDIRNDLYLTLEKGDFERGGKSVQKNIEVTMYVLYADGEILKVRFAGQFEVAANPVIISVFCGLCPESHPQTHPPQEGLNSNHFLRLFSTLASLQGNPAVCSDNDFQGHTAFSEILPSV